MADKKISALPAATTPLAGTEVLPIVQGGTTDQVSIANITAGRDVAVKKLNPTDNVVIMTAGKGIDFSVNTNAPGMTSELLTWYETGTWTPSFTSTGATITHAQQRGAYTRIGNLVTASVYIQISGVSGPISNPLSITGLPFASISGTEYGFSGAVGVHQFSGITPSLFMGQNATSITIYVNGTVTSVTPAALAAGYYLSTISYLVN